MNTRNFGSNLRIIREIFNYTQVYVARKTGISERTYRKYEKSEIIPSLDYVRKLESLYKLSLSVFLHLKHPELLNLIFIISKENNFE